MRLVVLAVVLAGCSLDGRPIHDWTLDFADTHDVAVRLPSNLLEVMPPTGLDFTLRAEVTLDAAEYGQPLTLVLACYHKALALTVDGESIPDDGDVGVGEHRYVIDAEHTQRGQLSFVLAAHRDMTSFGFTVEPRLVIGVVGTLPSARFNRALGVIELVLIGAFSFLYGLMYLLDRRRKAEGMFVIQALAALVTVLFSVGVLAELSGDVMPGIFGISLCITNLALLAYISYALDLGPPSRRWIKILIVLACLLALTPLSPRLSIALIVVQLVVTVAFSLHILIRLWRARRVAAHRVDATLLLAAQALAIVGGMLDTVQIAKSHNVLGGLHTGTVGILAWAIAQTIVLARRHVASEREVERVNAELRRQVAQRSSELVAALDQLAKREEPRDNALVDGRYRIVRELGAGGMGTVYEVEQLSHAKRLALKLVRGATADALARFAREAKIAAELDHPNLLPIVDVGVSNGNLFLVMPLVTGGSLEDARAQFGNSAWARPLIAAIARGIAALHARGVVHRDLKPANILVADGVPKIADFGVAAIRAEVLTVPGHHLTRAGEVLGTPRYMAPESAVSPAADMFAFGLIACEMFGKTRESIDPIIARCLDPDPERRPSAEEVAAVVK